MKVSKKTVRLFLDAWDVMSDNPTDVDEIMEWSEKENEKVYNFLEQLREFSKE